MDLSELKVYSPKKNKKTLVLPVLAASFETTPTISATINNHVVQSQNKTNKTKSSQKEQFISKNKESQKKTEIPQFKDKNDIMIYLVRIEAEKNDKSDRTSPLAKTLQKNNSKKFDDKDYWLKMIDENNNNGNQNGLIKNDDEIEEIYNSLVKEIKKVAYISNPPTSRAEILKNCKVSQGDRIFIIKWLEKLEETGFNPIWRKNRNLYTKLLLAYITRPGNEKLDEPFTILPKDEQLPTMPYYLRYKLKEMLFASHIHQASNANPIVSEAVKSIAKSRRNTGTIRKQNSASYLLEMYPSIGNTNNQHATSVPDLEKYAQTVEQQFLPITNNRDDYIYNYNNSRRESSLQNPDHFNTEILYDTSLENSINKNSKLITTPTISQCNVCQYCNHYENVTTPQIENNLLLSNPLQVVDKKVKEFQTNIPKTEQIINKNNIDYCNNNKPNYISSLPKTSSNPSLTSVPIVTPHASSAKFISHEKCTAEHPCCDTCCPKSPRTIFTPSYSKLIEEISKTNQPVNCFALQKAAINKILIDTENEVDYSENSKSINSQSYLVNTIISNNNIIGSAAGNSLYTGYQKEPNLTLNEKSRRQSEEPKDIIPSVNKLVEKITNLEIHLKNKKDI